MNYQKSYQKGYYPKRPIKSFQDLEVYQKLLAVATVVVKRIMENSGKKQDELVKSITAKLTDHLLALPVMLASAHSMRFSYPAEAIKKLEEAMLYSNLSVVHMEQYRDLGKHDIEPDFWQEQIKTLLATRSRILHLQFSWKKFMEQKKKEG